jgi:hypothetical protein
MNLDNITVGPVYAAPSPAMSDWVDAGPITITATTTNPTKGTIVRDKVFWRRVGDSAEIRFEYEQSAAGAAGSGDYLFTLPAGLSFDSAEVEFYTGAVAASPRYDRGVGVCTQTTVNLETSVVPYDATRFRVRGHAFDNSADSYISSSVHGFSNTTLRLSVEFSAPIAGWSGTTAVQPGSRYLWAQRFAATATRVTTTPSKPGEYRARRSGTDTAPTTGPTAGDGFRIDSGSGIAAGRINQYDIYVGPGKVVQFPAHLNAGRTGKLCTDLYYNTAYRGLINSYDPTTGVATICALTDAAGSAVGVDESLSTAPTTGYFDILIADDPVPVAIAPSVHVEASSDAGQVVTADVTDLQFEDKSIDTHGAWSGTVFTAPVAGVYAVSAAICSTAAGSVVAVRLYKNGTLYRDGHHNGTVGQRTAIATDLRLATGDTVRLRAASGVTRDATVVFNWLSITRIGD